MAVRGLIYLLRSYIGNTASVRDGLRDASEIAGYKGSSWLADRLGSRADHLAEEFIEEANSEGIERFERGDYQGAAEKFREVIFEDYTNYQGLRGLGASYDRMGDYEQAAYYYTSATVSDPEDPDIWLYLGSVQLALSRVDEGIESLKIGSELAPENLIIAKALARGMLQVDPEETLNLVESLIGVHGEDAELLVLRGYAHEDFGDSEALRRDIEAALAAEPMNAEAHHMASVAIPALSPERMLEHARIANEGFRAQGNLPGEAEALGNMAWAHYLAGEYPTAEKLSLQALEMDEQLTNVRFNLGLVRVASGDVDGARIAYEDALRHATLSDLREHGLEDLKDLISSQSENQGAREILAELGAREHRFVTDLRSETR